MKDHIEELRKRAVETFGAVGRDYLEAGLVLFHRYRHADSDFAQAAVGNLSLGAGQIMKSYISWKDLSAVFTTLSPETKLVLTNPDSVPRFFTWRNIDVDIGSRNARTLSFNSSVKCFYVFFPHLKQLLMPHVAVLDTVRDVSLHDTLSDLTSFELDRAAFAVLSIVDAISSDRAFDYVWHFPTDEDREFLRLFEERREERVALSIRQAEESAHHGRNEFLRSAASWDDFSAVCPVCKSAAHLAGYSELAVGGMRTASFPRWIFLQPLSTVLSAGSGFTTVSRCALPVSKLFMTGVSMSRAG